MRTHLNSTRMILEFGLPENGLIRLTPLLPKAAELRRLSSLRRVESLLPGASGLLLGLTEPPTESLLASLRAIRGKHRWLPVVVAGPEYEDGLELPHREQLMHAGVDRVISWSMLGRRDTETPSVWRQMPLLRLAMTVHAAEHLPAPARAVMVRAIAALRPVPSVAALAALGGLHRASLSRIWSRAARPVPAAGAFIDWMQLLHAAVRKDSGRTWRGVSVELGIRPSSIARMGKRVLGHTLSEYALNGRRQIFERFLREMVLMSAAEIRRHAPVAPPLSQRAIQFATPLNFESLALNEPLPEPLPEPIPARTPEAAHIPELSYQGSQLIGMWMA